MKIEFVKDTVIRDPKTREVVSSFKLGDIVDLSPDGAAYFIMQGEAIPSTVAKATASGEIAAIVAKAPTPVSLGSGDLTKIAQL